MNKTYEIADAIDTSIRQTQIVHIDAADFPDDFDVLGAFRCLDRLEGSADCGEFVEFWGRDSAGDEWRVHVHI